MLKIAALKPLMQNIVLLEVYSCHKIGRIKPFGPIKYVQKNITYQRKYILNNPKDAKIKRNKPVGLLLS
jgi:hypothetical protein